MFSKNKNSHFLLVMSLIIGVLMLFNGCWPKKNKITTPSPESSGIPTAGAPGPLTNSCVRIYYDRSPVLNYSTGYSHALLLKNFISHFSFGSYFLTPIEEYRSGDLLNCSYNFYLGSYYNNVLPTSFLIESMNPSTTIVWMGYNIWQLGSLFSNHFGYQFSGLSKFNPYIRDNTGASSFFSSIVYKDVIFKKDTLVRPVNPNKLPFEMAMLSPVMNPPISQTLAIAKNPWSNEFLPYAIKRNNKYYFADVPLTFISESQQYLILADLLFDIFNDTSIQRKPLVGVSIATDDLETLNPFTLAFIKELNQLNVPYFISLSPQIKRFRDSKLQTTEEPFHQEETKNNLIKTSQGILWNLSENQKSKTILDFLAHLKKQQNQLIKLGLKPLALMESQADHSLQENLVLGQLFPTKIGLSEVYNFTNSKQIPQNHTSLISFNFPISEIQFNSLNLKVPQLMDSFHQSLFTPYIIQSDIAHQKVIPLLTTLGEQTNMSKITDQMRVLSVIKNSTHFINIENSAFQSQQNFEKALSIIKYYKTLNYQFINYLFFK